MGGHPTPRTGRTAVSTFYWSAKTFAVAPATRLLFRPWVKGLGNVPAEGAAILASNHLSVSDSVFMPAMLKRQVHFLAKKDYFTGAGPKGWITRKFFEATNQLPMDRSGGEASLRSLDAGLEALREGRLLGIYPEGTRSPDGRLHRGKIGVAALPAGPGGKPAATLGGWQLAVNAYSKNPKEAASLVQYLTGKEEQKRRAIQASYNPTIASLYKDKDVLKAVPFFGSLYDVFTNAVARPATVTGSKYNQVSDAFSTAVYNVLTKKSAPGPAMKTLEGQLNRIKGRGW